MLDEEILRKMSLGNFDDLKTHTGVLQITQPHMMLTN